MTHPITPPPELVEQWEAETAHTTKDETWHVAVQAARWGAEERTHAICGWLDKPDVKGAHLIDPLLRHFYPKPPSLKEQALKAARIELLPDGKNAALIIRALEALPDD